MFNKKIVLAPFAYLKEKSLSVNIVMIQYVLQANRWQSSHTFAALSCQKKFLLTTSVTAIAREKTCCATPALFTLIKRSGSTWSRLMWTISRYLTKSVNIKSTVLPSDVKEEIEADLLKCLRSLYLSRGYLLQPPMNIWGKYFQK